MRKTDMAYVERLEEERKILEHRLSKLKYFMNNKSELLEEREKELMIKQAQLMQEYADILGERAHIAFTKHGMDK